MDLELLQKTFGITRTLPLFIAGFIAAAASTSLLVTAAGVVPGVAARLIAQPAAIEFIEFIEFVSGIVGGGFAAWKLGGQRRTVVRFKTVLTVDRFPLADIRYDACSSRVSVPPPVPAAIGFSWIDFCVVMIGFAFAAYAWWRDAEEIEGHRLLLGFASGTATAYLVGCVIFMWFDPSMYMKLLESNRVLVCGSFAYAAVENFRTLPGLSRRKGPPDGK